VGIPVVLSGRPFRPDDDIPNVDADNVAGARLATRALLDVGCSRLATITGPLDMPAAQDRLSGYEAELTESGRKVATTRTVESDFTTEGGFDAMNRLLRNRFAPDGVFAANDQMAVGAMRAVREAGLQVPRDVKVVGFDDSPLATAAHPPLTSVRQPMEELGREMAHLLMSLVNGEATRTSVMLPTELVVRGTC
jgi:DNA-binding LacI/PurR family transcriptional regulator